LEVETAFGDWVGKKIPNDGGSVFEVVEGFKKRNDGDLTYKPLRGPVG
jgi:hypothetical protein